MCYKYVPVSDEANLLQLVVVPSVHPLHHSASHIAAIDLIFIFGVKFRTFTSCLCMSVLFPYPWFWHKTKKLGSSEITLWCTTTNINSLL